jgi:hypothetical protein
VHPSDVAAAVTRRRTWVVRALALLVVPAAVALAGTGPSLPAPDLQLVSTTDPQPPTGVTAVSTDRGLDISWTAPAELIVITGY